jgi:hypothetical protein
VISTPDEEARQRAVASDDSGPGAIAARNIYLGNSITVSGDFVFEPRIDGTNPVSSFDVTEAVATVQTAFVEPPHFPEVMRLLKDNQVVLLTGDGLGNFTAAGAALYEMKRRPILELSAGVSTQPLITNIVRLCRKEPTVGILVESVSAEMLSEFSSFDLGRLKRALAKSASLILTTAMRPDLRIDAFELRTVAGAAPDPAQVIRSLAQDQGIEDQARDIALAALELLPRPVSPAVAVALVRGARDSPRDSPDRLARLSTKHKARQPRPGPERIAPAGDARPPEPAARVVQRTADTRAPAQPEPVVRVFLCHASDDKPAVKRFDRRLRTDHIDTWLDERDLLPGQEWDQTIRVAVRDADIVVVCLSRTSVTKSGYLQREIKHVLDVADEQPDGSIFLIPARLEECDVPERLRRWQWVDLYKRGGYNRIMTVLREAAARRRHLE